jgi:hypothetical protein
MNIYRFKPRVASQNLRRLPEGAEERPSHLVAIAEPVWHATTSIGWRLCSMRLRALSTRRFSMTLAED